MSMMVTLEVIKVVQTLWMEWDEKMRSDPLDKDTGMNAKTSNLNDELALVYYKIQLIKLFLTKTISSMKCY